VIPLVDLSVVNRPVVLDEFEKRLRRIVVRNDFVDGPEVAEFEEAWADFVGARYCVGVANGTDALELAVRGTWGAVTVAGLSMPALSFVATAEAVVRAGEKVMLHDVDPATLTVPAGVGVNVQVGLYGASVIGRGGVVDAAQMHGLQLPGRTASWSFYPTKNLGAWGDAGAVTTDDEGLAQGIRELARHGDGGRFGVGFNSRLDTVQALLLLVKLPRLRGWVEARRQAVGQYRRRLAGSSISVVTDDRSSVCHQMVVRVPSRATVQAEMAATYGVETGVHYRRALSEMGWLDPFRVWPSECPEAEAAAREVLSLPLWPGIMTSTIEQVVDALMRSVEAAERLAEVTR
jgi:dTDP-4-amino-4,6-dideoxygalactose transaminase